MYKILLVEDDAQIAGQLQKILAGWGYQAYVPEDFKDILASFMQVNPDLVIMDLYLPGKNGFYWTSKIREVSSLPILFLSSADENMNVITALSQGADDYVTKPFDPMVLVTKIQALLRRTYDYQGKTNFVEYKGVRLEMDSHEAAFEGKSVELSKNEARILKILMENKNRVVSREALMEALWKTDSYVDENTLSVNVNRLRRKLDQIDVHDYIQTRKGSGYIIT